MKFLTYFDRLKYFFTSSRNVMGTPHSSNRLQTELPHIGVDKINEYGTNPIGGFPHMPPNYQQTSGIEDLIPFSSTPPFRLPPSQPFIVLEEESKSPPSTNGDDLLHLQMVNQDLKREEQSRIEYETTFIDPLLDLDETYQHQQEESPVEFIIPAHPYDEVTKEIREENFNVTNEELLNPEEQLNLLETDTSTNPDQTLEERIADSFDSNQHQQQLYGQNPWIQDQRYAQDQPDPMQNTPEPPMAPPEPPPPPPEAMEPPPM